MQKHLIQAAERGDAEAQFNLAIMYENGVLDSHYVAEGGDAAALQALLAAAGQGKARAQVKLAEIYAAAPDRAPGSLEACKWYLLATRELRGEHRQKAQSAYDKLAAGLTPAQTAEVSQFVQDWKPTNAPAAAISDRLTAAGHEVAA